MATDAILEPVFPVGTTTTTHAPLPLAAATTLQQQQQCPSAGVIGGVVGAFVVDAELDPTI